MTIDEKDLYVENYRTLLGEIKEDLSKWRDILWLYFRRLSVVKLLILPK